MNRIIKYITFTFLLTFLFIFNVKAECSYQERKDLLNAAKNVDISIEPVEVSVEKGVYDFKFNIANVTNDIFIKYYNLNNGIEKYISYNDLSNGLYSFVDENSFNVYNYKFVFYSNNNNCPGYELTTKIIKKPMFNRYSENINCTLEGNENFKYCQKFLEKDYNLTLEKFLDELFLYNTKNIENINENQNNNSNLNILMIGIVMVVLILLIIVISRIIKKRNKL